MAKNIMLDFDGTVTLR